jgi:hypothetical protein
MGKAQQKKRGGTHHKQAVAEVSTWGWSHPVLGNYLTIAAAVCLQFTIILLPLVGPAGSVAPHAWKNLIAWRAMVFLTMAMSGMALYSKLQRRRQDGSRLPLISIALLGVSVFLFFAQMAGLLAI